MSAWEGSAAQEAWERAKAVACDQGTPGCQGRGEKHMCFMTPQTRVEDPINPAHYKKSPSGIEVIEITRHLSFNLGNVVKYVLRAGHKTPDPIEDLRKAAWYLNDELKRLEKK